MSSSSPPSAKRRRLDFSEEVTVIAGEEEKRFIFPKNVLAKHSKFFRAAFSNGFKETQEKWSYSGQVVLTDTVEEENVKNGLHFRPKLAKFYVVADRLEDTLLRNAILDIMIESMQANGKGPGQDVVAQAYDNTATSSKLRKLVLEWHAFAIVHPSQAQNYVPWLERNMENFPAEFVSDVLLGVAKDRAGDTSVVDPENAEQCRYHDDDEEVPVCTTVQKS